MRYDECIVVKTLYRWEVEGRGIVWMMGVKMGKRGIGSVLNSTKYGFNQSKLI